MDLRSVLRLNTPEQRINRNKVWETHTFEITAHVRLNGFVCVFIHDVLVGQARVQKSCK